MPPERAFMLHSAQDLFSPDGQDIAAFEKERSRRLPARLRYVVWFTPRSGSSWLTDIARKTDRLGDPGECFNPNFLPNMARSMNAANMDQYIQILLRRRRTRGVFGCELTFYHLQRCFDDVEDFMRYFDGAPAVWLIREDIVLQAVSLVKMQQTSIAHSAQSGPEDRARAEALFVYDPEQIEYFVRHIIQAEAGCERVFNAYGHRPLRLSYERNMAMGANHVLNAIAHHIGLRPIPHRPVETGHQKLRTGRNGEFAARFRAERAGFVARIEEARTRRLAALDGDLPGRLPPAYRGQRPENRPPDPPA